jgi:hypothetical protein
MVRHLGDAVGTALASGPRTDPSVLDYRTGLLPWVRGGEARLREWVHGAGRGYPPGRDADHSGPGDSGPLATVRNALRECRITWVRKAFAAASLLPGTA